MRLRSNLEFMQSALSVLKLKRDRLSEELNSLLKGMARRDFAEKRLTNVYSKYKLVLATLGYSLVQAEAHSVKRMKVQISELSLMNIPIPRIEATEMSISDTLADPGLYQIALELQDLAKEFLEIAGAEAGIERIAYEFTLVNRRINAIEKSVIPVYQSRIKYIEDFLSDEELEDFTRIKHIKTVLKGKNA